MIGLGSSITSSVSESKHSASFDGQDDFIDTQQTFQSIFRGSFAISFWIKPNDGIPSASQFLFGSTDADVENVIRFSIHTDGTLLLFFKSNDDEDSFRTSSAIFSDGAATSWNHVVLDVIKPVSGNTSAVIYINGNPASLQGSGTSLTAANHALFTTSSKLAIGGRRVSTGGVEGFYSGGIDEFGIYNRAFDDNVIISKIYNNGVPKNLTLIDEDGINDNLQLYYRMGDGNFDDIKNGVIHNQVNPGLGSNLVVNGDFSISNTYSTVSSINPNSPWIRTPDSGTTTVIDNGVATFTDVGFTNAKLLQSVTYSLGSAYKLSATARLISGATSRDIRVRDNNNINNGALTDADRFSITTDKKYVVFYFLANSNSDAVVIDRRSSGTYTFTVDDIILKKLNSIPGITSGGVTFSSDTP